MRPALVLTLLALAPSAFADTLYTVRESDDVLVRIDTATGTFTDVGPLGVSFAFGGLTTDDTGTVWMIGGRGNENLYTVDTSTGAATLVGNYGVGDLFGLEYNPDDGNLYGATTRNLYQLDPTSGAATLIGPFNFSGGTGSSGASSLGWSPTLGLITINVTAPDIHSIDPTTGQATYVGGSGASRVDNNGFTWSAADGAYYSIDWSSNFYRIDPTTLAFTSAGTITEPHDGLTAASVGGPSGPNLRFTGSCPGMITIDITGLTPGSQFAAARSGSLGTFTIPGGGCGGTTLGLASPSLVGIFPTGSGTQSFMPSIGGGSCGDFVQVVDLDTCATSNVEQF